MQSEYKSILLEDLYNKEMKHKFIQDRYKEVVLKSH